MPPSGVIPAWNAPVNYQANLTNDVSNIAPLASTWHGAQTGVQVQQVNNTPAVTEPSNVSKFFGFLGGTLDDIGHVASGVGSWLGKTAVTAVEAPYKLGEGIGNGLVDRLTLDSNTKQTAQTSQQLDNLTAAYKAGVINSTQYKEGTKGVNEQLSNIMNENKAVSNRIGFDQKATTSALINTASDLVTVLTAGFGKAAATEVNIAGGKFALSAVTAKTASEWLTSKAADTYLQPVINGISRVASQPEVYKALDAGTQEILERSTAEVVANAGDSMTAAQIGRATAANVALKYPLMYSYTSSTASQIYQDLDQQKYGDAVRSLAYNAALVLSGGIIGQAIKYGGKAASSATVHTFGQSSFWDELSKFVGDGSPDGYIKAIADKADSIQNDAARGRFIKNMGAAEATNLAAVGGDPIAAAARVAKGMQGQYSFDLSTISHAESVDDMDKFYKNFRIADAEGRRMGIGPVASGRLDARDKSSIIESITQGTGSRSRLNQWKAWKADNPDAAAANNANFDKQIKNIIRKSSNISQDIMDIKAGITIPGFNKEILASMAKDGYIPIKPSNVEAPFKEGGQQLVTKFGEPGNDIFIKSVQPLPVLEHVGALLTNLGLSPVASTQRVYQMFTDNLSKELAETDIGKSTQAKLDSEAAARIEAGKLPKPSVQSSDYLVKQLSNYAHGLKIPVSDLRMLTTKQISKALSIGHSDARDIQDAIAAANTKVPLAVRGLGDKAVDWSLRLPVASPIQRRYLKLQGALRFSFNPFFQYLHAIPKTEILSEAEGGGYLSSIFAGRSSEIDGVRTALREGGFLDTPGRLGTTIGAEGVDSIGMVSKNLSKHLLPMQERSIAGLIDSQATRLNMDAATYMKNYPDHVRDTIQMIAEYDKNSNFLNSPLARTLNIAFFPFRFDAKVMTIMGRSLARSGLITQVSVVNGIFKAHAFLNSPEGQAWYSQNAQAISVFNYILPFASMADVFSSLLPGHDHSLGNFGELGGLPFGWIPQLLDSEGLTHFNQPYVDASTGQTIPNYIPATTKGQAAVAIQDFLGALFTYPGSELGLPSKTSVTRSFALGLTGATTKADFNSVTPTISGQQAQFAKTVQNLPANAAANQSQATPGQTSYNSNFQVAPQYSPLTTPIPRTGTADSSSSTKKKKADYTPGLLPGQTQLGVT